MRRMLSERYRQATSSVSRDLPAPSQLQNFTRAALGPSVVCLRVLNARADVTTSFQATGLIESGVEFRP
jgi:hypothetical protein